MKGKTHSTEEIIRILRQADGGETAQAVCREHTISEQPFYRWKKKYGDMELADAKRLKELEKENVELKKMLAEAMLENRVLKEVNSKKWCALRRKKRPSPMWLASGCARCAGRVAIWPWPDRRIGMRRNPCPIGSSNCTSALWCCPGPIRAMAIGASVEC
jgi:putative transposase|tara:strand:+ start:214 stop:693 length:480 start_codon:yes stop_codon:yes gene_type:complete